MNTKTIPPLPLSKQKHIVAKAEKPLSLCEKMKCGENYGKTHETNYWS